MDGWGYQNMLESGSRLRSVLLIGLLIGSRKIVSACVKVGFSVRFRGRIEAEVFAVMPTELQLIEDLGWP